MSDDDWPPIEGEEPETHARRYDPDTSHATARRIKITSQARRVLRAYAITGRELTDHDAYRLVGFPTGRTSHQRCSDLRDWGFIERTTRGLSPSRHSAWQCRITELGVRFLMKMEPFH
jgi:hypothetical protein